MSIAIGEREKAVERYHRRHIRKYQNKQLKYLKKGGGTTFCYKEFSTDFLNYMYKLW